MDKVTFTETELEFESIDRLGFAERKVYKFQTKTTLSSEELLVNILESDIFYESENYVDYSGSKPKNYTVRTNCAFTDKVDFQDFVKLNFEGLKNRINEIGIESDWGDDLPAFKKLTNKTINWIEKNNHQKAKFYFIYTGSVSKDKLIEHNFYTYFMSIIIISSSKVIIINHGGD